MATSESRTKRSKNYKERPNLKRLQIEKQGPNWSDIPCDIVECIIRYLGLEDRFRIRAVCKAWSVANSHIPSIAAIDRFPWALKKFGSLYGDYRLLDPFSGEYLREKILGGKECRLSFVENLFGRSRVCSEPNPYASVYGWVLFGCYLALPPQRKMMLFLYSPFTSEVIKLPELKEGTVIWVATFSLNATSPKCVIFLLALEGDKNYVKLCSPGDYSWKSLELNSGIKPIHADSAMYANGVFYCYFLHGQLAGFNVELEEWTVLCSPSKSLPLAGNLVMIDADLFVFDRLGLKLKLFKFDFSEMRWVYEKDLNKHALFIGCSSFSVPAVGETSDLANSIVSYKKDFSNEPLWSIRCYGSRSSKRKWLQRTESLLHRKCVEENHIDLRIWEEHDAPVLMYELWTNQFLSLFGISFVLCRWTFTLITIYFGLGSLLSMRGCYQDHKRVTGDKVDNVELDAEQGKDAFGETPNNAEKILNPRPEGHFVSQRAGTWGYVFQIIFQMNAGAVLLTDCVFWFIIVPFLAIKDYYLSVLAINMHTINAVFLLGDTAMNCLRFPCFRIAYFFLWTVIYVIFQWIVHACVNIWWPYPFLDLSSSYAPLWYFSVALMHFPCYGAFALVTKLKHHVFSRWFPESYHLG
ncbi:hypothetical protein V6N11_027813 [Hibiscus sabdariffa]|uniref:F-box domain-containing protein n=1 Tax=Hibiscus sabdariffa TaxID=183260 RepID=A0ABR2NZA7_9ROSI